MSRFLGFVVVLVAAFQLFGCAARDVKFPPGPGASIPPGYMVVFGKIEIKSDLTCADYYGKQVCEKIKNKNKLIPTLYDWPGREGRFEINYETIPVIFGEDFYAVVPESGPYFFNWLEYEVVKWFWSKPDRIGCPAGFPVPGNAAAVYIGTIVLKFEGPLYEADFFGGFKKHERPYRAQLTLSSEDEFDPAVQRLRNRNPGFRGRIVKSLFRHRDRLQSSDGAPSKMACTRVYEFEFVIPFVLS